MRPGISGFKARHLLFFHHGGDITEAKIVGEGDIKCGSCHHMLSSVGREVGLVFWDIVNHKWIVTCASERCSEIPGKTEVSKLQNYWLGKTMGGTICVCEKPDIEIDHGVANCKTCGGVC